MPVLVNPGEIIKTDDPASVITLPTPKPQTFLFYGDVNEDTARVAVSDLEDWSEESPDQPLTFVISSPGGSVADALYVYETLRELSRRGHKVTTVARGQVSSAAVPLLQAGEHRVMGKHSRLLLHEPTCELEGNLSELRTDVEVLGETWETLCAIVAERSGIDKFWLLARTKGEEWRLASDEAQRHNLVDEVVS